MYPSATHTVTKRVDKTDGDRPHRLLFSWIYSPSGRYAVEIHEEELDDADSQRNTHYFLYRFFILDVDQGEWSEYRSSVGPLKTMYTSYWLSDDHLVLLDFSRHEECLRQNIIELDHQQRIVDCSFARNYEWKVDEMASIRDSNVQPLTVNKEEYVAVFAFCDSFASIHFRCLPFNPLAVTSSIDSSREFRMDEAAVVAQLAQNGRWFVRGHPFCSGSRILILMGSETADADGRVAATDYSVCRFLSIDMHRIHAEQQDENILTHRSPGVGILECHVPAHPSWRPSINWRQNIYNTRSKLVIWPRNLRVHTRADRIFVVDLEKATIVTTKAKLNTCSFLSLHPNGSLFAWRQSRSESADLKVSSVPYPRLSAPSLLQCVQSKLLTSRSPQLARALPEYLPFLFQ